MRYTRREPGFFNLRPFAEKLPRPVGAMVRPPLESLLGFPLLNEVYAGARHPSRSGDFPQAVLEQMGISVQVSKADLERIPQRGALVAVANHPFGGLEGLILASVLARVRPDVKLLANFLLGHIPELRNMSIFVDPFGGETAARANVRGMKQSLKWLRDGHALGAFPSGEVAHLHLRKRRITDSKWNPHIAALARRGEATVLPVFFSGANSAFFQIAGLLHPRLRTALLIRETYNKQHKSCHVRIGKPIPAKRLAAFQSERTAISYMRRRTELLRERRDPDREGKRKLKDFFILRGGRQAKPSEVEAIIEPVDTRAIASEIDRLPARALLAEHGPLAVYLAAAGQIPSGLREIGRLREVTFRKIGEGSGKALDIDEFDSTYQHLFVWDRENEQMVGSYRLGLIDELLFPRYFFFRWRRDLSNIYISSLFRFQKNFFDELGPAIELGRSFIREEYQRRHTSLMLLWQGIGGFLAENPRYRYLIGPVSISNDYSRISKALMVRFLSRPQYRSEMAAKVKPRTPFPMRKFGKAGVMRLARQVRDVQEFNDLIRDVEPDGKGVPILIRQYLTLGGRAMTFNVDPDFGFCLDCLYLFDVTTTGKRAICRYMGRDNARKYLQAHGIDLDNLDD